MTIEEIQKSADDLRAEARLLLNRMFGLPEGVSSAAVDRIVDCIVGAAVFEIAITMSKSSKG